MSTDQTAAAPELEFAGKRLLPHNVLIGAGIILEPGTKLTLALREILALNEHGREGFQIWATIEFRSADWATDDSGKLEFERPFPAKNATLLPQISPEKILGSPKGILASFLDQLIPNLLSSVRLGISIWDQDPDQIEVTIKSRGWEEKLRVHRIRLLPYLKVQDK